MTHVELDTSTKMHSTVDGRLEDDHLVIRTPGRHQLVFTVLVFTYNCTSNTSTSITRTSIYMLQAKYTSLYFFIFALGVLCSVNPKKLKFEEILVQNYDNRQVRLPFTAAKQLMINAEIKTNVHCGNLLLVRTLCQNLSSTSLWRICLRPEFRRQSAGMSTARRRTCRPVGLY